MEVISEELCQFFPITNTLGFINLMKYELDKQEPKLALLSLLCGVVENNLTNPKRNVTGLDGDEKFPLIQLSDIQTLYCQYLAKISAFKQSIGLDVSDLDVETSAYTSRETIKKISSFVWSQIKKGFFKDKQHIQSMLGLVTGGNLDCFGIAFSVVAIAQSLALSDVHLSLSEDHSWINFGKDGNETAEVTWYGKGNEQKRGMPIDYNIDDVKENWLYLGHHEVKCDRLGEAAALISSINPGINSKMDSELLGSIQQELLWILYDKGTLDTYTMALCNLADLEEIKSTRTNPSIDDLYKQAIKCNQEVYSNHHVFPYTCYGGYLYRTHSYQKAINVWKKGAHAASKYCHSGESEELYKDFAEILDTFVPAICKECKKMDPAEKLVSSILNSAHTFRDFILFFDCLCLWEEHSQASVIHNDWAKSFVNFVAMFSCTLRNRVDYTVFQLDSGNEMLLGDEHYNDIDATGPCEDEKSKCNLEFTDLKVNLRSCKMKEICKHLRKEKIDSNTIKLQLTALMTRPEKKKSGSGTDMSEYRPERKRSRKL